jgi:hypothetical protein
MCNVDSLKKLLSGEYYANNKKENKCFLIYKNQWLILDPKTDGDFTDNIPIFDYILKPFDKGKIEDLVKSFTEKKVILGTTFYYYDDEKIHSKLNQHQGLPLQGVGLDEFLGNIFDHLNSRIFNIEETEFFNKLKI